MGFISKKADIRGTIVEGAVIFGKSLVLEGSFVDASSIIGYPSRDKLLKIKGEKKGVISLEKIDELSEGSYIGSGCIIRSYCIVYERVELVENVELGHGVLIRSGSRVESGTRIGSFSQLDGEVKIGKNTNIQSQVYLPHLTTVGNNVFIGPAAKITNDKYPVSKRLVETIIEDDVIIGSGALILPGVKIGHGAVIAAGAIVSKDVRSGVVVVGAPAREVYSRDEYESRRRRYESGERNKI